MDLNTINTPAELLVANEAPPETSPNLELAAEAYSKLSPLETKELLLQILHELVEIHGDIAEDEADRDPESALAWARDERSLVIMWNIMHNIEL